MSQRILLPRSPMMLEVLDCHRAIDDLYTLAEMECNLWQARNIVQLLDESTADFRQVGSHVDHLAAACLAPDVQSAKISTGV